MNQSIEFGSDMVPSNSIILVGVPIDVQASTELLSWAIEVAAQPDDTVVALHVLVGKDSTAIDMNKMRRAKAFVISVLGEFAELCQSKKVNLEAKVRWYSSIRKGLIEEAASLEAAFLVIGGSRNRSQRTSLEITKHCFKRSPEGCSVVAIRKRGLPHQYSDSKSMPDEGFHHSSSKVTNKDIQTSKSLSSLQKLLKSMKKGENSFNKSKSLWHSPTESLSEKYSPRAVLDGPEVGVHVMEDCFSPGDFSNIDSPPLEPKSSEFNHRSTQTRSNIWKSLSMVKIFSPLFRSAVYDDVKEKENCPSDEENRLPSLRCFSYEEISHATNNFHPDNMVGKGGYAEVYRGNLYDGQTIAVKRLSKDNTDEHKEKEFLTELGVIGHVCHPNTAFLIGCCIENGLHLIFNFSPNGTLASALHGKESLEWPVRYKIVIGVARGLHYLHKCCKRRIIHRDIKASNVLLGPDFEPQISDFGLAKWLPTQWTHHSVIPIEGTFGYLAPEYFMHGIVDEKTDIFSFGVLLLEIITGRRPVDSSKQNILSWAKPLIESGNIADLADPKLGGKYDMDQMHRLVLTASYCVRQSSIWRPSMSEVLQLVTDGHDSKITLSWRTSEYNADELDDYSMNIDCQCPISYNFEDYL
ncbi:probable receptor-like serine/threonine-protein kinase At5g57670 [Magnolia sinica]|uniref:probable receptor-like serine/threonine-protein kinase At5g57670 n=1 Tax=Magnolia sinica TaxID=86752 RepID=UPI002659383E|nr:probable receptor-like serine/threonine-protein kinase At5g57670 [Magnolia sinica]